MILKFIFAYCLITGIIGVLLVFIEDFWNGKGDWEKACDYLDAVEDGDIKRIMELNEDE